MELNVKDITSFLTFRYPISLLKNYKYPYTSSFKEQLVDFDVAKGTAEILLRTAIKNYMDKSDRPAVMMSGGLDSVLLVALMKEIDPSKKIHLYTAKFNTNFETMQAKYAAKILNLPHTLVEIYPADYFIPQRFHVPLIKLGNRPLHPNEIALAKTEAQAKKDGCDTVFCGEGADDVFGGYDKLLTFYKKSQDYLDFFKFYRYFSLNDRQQIIKPDYLMYDTEILPNMFWVYPRLEFRYSIWKFIQQVHTPGLLMRGANAAKYNGLDIAFPYTDRDLFSYVNSLPFEYKIFGATSKYILREIALKYLPYRFAYAGKYPFPVPFERWLGNTDTWDLNKKLFLSNNISKFSGWHKWMLINLNTWLETINEK